MKIYRLFFLTISIFLLTALPGICEGIKDAESATHGYDAAQYVVQGVFQGENYRVAQFNLAVLSHYSYILDSDGKALIVDPGRDIQAYLDYAKKNNLEWAGVFLTHSHADFIAGHREMALATGAPIYAGHKSGALFPHVQVMEGTTIKVGKARLTIIETPGHTPDGLCAVVSPESSPDKKQFLFSGDTLFVGGVGRPDLMGGTVSASELAEMLLDSWNNKLAKLPDDTVVLPAHGAGSLCGAHLSEEPSSTIGQEKVSNFYLKNSADRSAFIASVISGLGKAPGYFGENARINREGPEIVDWKAPYKDKILDYPSLSDKNQFYVVDTRSAEEYSTSHIPNSVNIALRGRFETWTGIIVPWGSNLVVVGNEKETFEAATRLKRIGYKTSYVDFKDYIKSGVKTSSSPMIKPSDLYAQMVAKKAPLIVDVRLPKEWTGMRIGEVVNIPLNELAAIAPGRLNKNDKIVAVCNSAFRSSLAVGLLERNGFKSAMSMEGGADAWIEAGYPVIRDVESANTTQSHETYRSLGLPERISAKALLEIIKDLPGTVEIIDIRPKSQVERYNPTGARAADISDVLENLTYLAGDVPLIIIDRDGTLAMMVAGILSRKTKRNIKAVIGGVESIWREVEMKFGETMISPSTGKNVSPSAPSYGGESVTPSGNSVPRETAPAEKPKRKSAGC